MLMSFVGNVLPGVQSRQAAMNVPMLPRRHSGTPRTCGGAHQACSPQSTPGGYVCQSPGDGFSTRSAKRAATMGAVPEEHRISAQLLEERSGVQVWGPARNKDGQRLPRILCYGDSNTVGYHNGGKNFQPYGQTLACDLLDSGMPCEIVICGLCGYTTQEMLNEKSADTIDCGIGPNGRGLARIIEDSGPIDFAIIMTGTNDMGMLTGIQTIVQDVAQLHAICHDRGIPTVAVAPTQGPGRKCRQVRQKLADALAAWANSVAAVLDFVDVEDLVSRPNGKDGNSNQPSAVAHWERDDLHFSAAGSIALGHRMAPHATSWLRSAATGTPVQSRKSGMAAVSAASSRPLKKVEVVTPSAAKSFAPSPGGCAFAVGVTHGRRHQRARTMPALAVLSY